MWDKVGYCGFMVFEVNGVASHNYCVLPLQIDTHTKSFYQNKCTTEHIWKIENQVTASHAWICRFNPKSLFFALLCSKLSIVGSYEMRDIAKCLIGVDYM